MDKRMFKDRVYERLATVAKALASPRRIELVELLAQAERTVEWLACETGMSVANTSRHLQVLRGAHLVTPRKDGLYVWYRLSGPSIERLWGSVRGVAEEQDAEVDRLVRDFFADRASLEAVPLAELVGRLDEVVLVDVRPSEEFVAAHLPGARSLPLDGLDAGAAELPSDRAIVVYCRGPYCVFADEAVRRLRDRGFVAARLDAGLPEWRMAGRPVEVGA